MTVEPSDIKYPQTIREINGFDRDEKEDIYQTLIPDQILEQFNLVPSDRGRVKFICPNDTRAVEVRVYNDPDAPDPLFYLHMADSLNYQISILLVIINDPDAPRFNTDVTDSGLPTRFGTLRRNIAEETRAREAGLAPGQIRQGLRLFKQFLPLVETFCKRAGHDLVIIDPLSYNNAIGYEKHGFSYFQGKQRMEWINKVLRPDGEFMDKLDGSTPFRQPEAWKSIRGRSWAIHDGILGEPFGDIRMYKRIGHHAGVNTFPDGIW